MNEDEPDLDRIIVDSTVTLEACPDDVNALCQRGRAWLEKKQYDEAIHSNPTHDELIHVHYNRGRSHAMNGEHTNAIEDFSEAIIHDPKHALAFQWRALVWNVLGEYHNAMAQANPRICDV